MGVVWQNELGDRHYFGRQRKNHQFSSVERLPKAKRLRSPSRGGNGAAAKSFTWLTRPGGVYGH